MKQTSTIYKTYEGRPNNIVIRIVINFVETPVVPKIGYAPPIQAQNFFMASIQAQQKSHEFAFDTKKIYC